MTDVALKYCAEITKEIAEEYNLLLADFRDELLGNLIRINSQLYQK